MLTRLTQNWREIAYGSVKIVNMREEYQENTLAVVYISINRTKSKCLASCSAAYWLAVVMALLSKELSSSN